MANTRRNITLGAALLLVAAAVTPPALAQEEQYREKQVLDPSTDEWVDAAPETEAVPAGVLGQARALLARGEARKARRLLAKWVKANPDHERYYEATFLLGEALFETRDFYAAFERYEEVAENAAGELFFKALRRELDVARAFLSGEKRVVWKFMRLPAHDEGVDILDRIWVRAPGTRLAEEALKEKADYYFNAGEMDLAQDEYVNLVQEYPSGRYVQLAMLRAAEAAEAAFPGVRFDPRALADADARYRQLETTFPQFSRRENVTGRRDGIRRQRAESDLDVARWYERTRRPDSAAFYYRLILKDWPDTPSAAQARVRLRALGLETPEENPQP